MRHFFWFIFSALVLLASCRKKEDPGKPDPVSTLGKVSFTFENIAGTVPLILNNEWYFTDNGDSLKVTQYKYYVTNFVLHSDSGDFVEPESYYLIDESNNSSKYFVVDSIPLRRYSRISFLVGVDAKRNKSGAQVGALDPLHTMFWDWNTGYIMAKLEGISPQAPNQSEIVSYHIAGFKPGESVLKTITLDLPQPIDVNPHRVNNIHIKADILEWFKSPHVIKISELNIIGSLGSDAMKIADNYADMFKIDHID